MTGRPRGISVVDRPKERYGYVIVGSAFLAYLLVAGTYYGLPVLVPVMARDLGWSATAFGAAFSVLGLLLGVSGPVVGAFVARFGPRRAIMIGSLLMVASLGLLSLTNAIWQLYLLLIGVGLGFGLATMLPMQQLIGSWFVTRRSMFLGVVMSGAGLGGMVIAPLTSGLEGALGSWRPVWLVLAGFLLVPVLLALFVIRDRPDDVGRPGASGMEKSDRTLGSRDQSGNDRADRVYRSACAWETKAAIRTRAFWLIALAGGLMFFLLQGITAHQVAYLVEERRTALTVAASALGLIAGSSVVGRLASGWLGDRIEPRFVMAGLLLLMSFSLVVLLTGGGLVTLYLYVVLFGIGYGGIIVLGPGIVLNYYGPDNSAAIMGVGMFFQAFLGALGGVVVGGIKDVIGTYVPAFVLMIGLGVAAALAASLASPPVPGVDAPQHGRDSSA